MVEDKIELILYIWIKITKMNSPGYRKAYLEQLNLQVSNNNKNEKANKGNPSGQQYMQNSGQSVLGLYKGKTILKK